MKSTTDAPADSGRFAYDGNELVTDYRQRRALEERQRAEEKSLQLADQHSTLNGADVRIRAWEKVHHLRMPSDPFHPVLDVIAAATQLTLADVQNEQRVRAGRRSVDRA